MEDKKKELIEIALLEFEAEKKKKKAKKGEPEIEFDPSKVVIKLNEELLIKAYKWRLSQSDCLNKGYILDGFPRTFK